jgi:hypothetical protein
MERLPKDFDESQYRQHFLLHENDGNVPEKSIESRQ